VFQRLRWFAASLALLSLADPVHLATAGVHPATPARAVDAAPESSAAPADSSTRPPAPGPDLGVAVASCRLGVRLAAESSWTLTGVGAALCVAGLMFELEDAIDAHRP